MRSVFRLWWSLVTFGFRLLYNELAFTYDTVSTIVSLGAWRCWQRQALKFLPASTDGIVLELAHGTGNLQIDLKTRGYATIGYDLSPNMGKITRRKLLKRSLSVDLIRGQAQTLPFAEGGFQAVVSTFPTSFIVEESTLREIWRVLKPGGTLIIVPNGALVGGGIVNSFIEWLYRITGQRGASMDGFKQYFEKHGFTAEIVYENCPRSVATVIICHKMV
ncbi:MAG: class I SAM-dependent methyltransferase [Aggregatilineales bacterium]